MMSKPKALVLLIFFDLFAMLVFWLGCHEINQVVAGIADSADSVELNNRVGFFFLGVVAPMVHLLGIYEYFWPKVIEKNMALLNGATIIISIVLFAAAFIISAHVRTYVERSGYVHCRPADKSMTFCVYLSYTKDAGICRRLVEEQSSP